MADQDIAYENKVRELAYQLWEVEGRPQGQVARHWQLARELAETELEGYIEPITRLSPLEPLEQLEPNVPD